MFTEDFRAFLIPARSRDKYFETINNALDLFPKSMRNCPIDAYSDPIVKFTGWSCMSEKCQTWWTLKMKEMGAKDVTESYEEA